MGFPHLRDRKVMEGKLQLQLRNMATATETFKFNVASIKVPT